MSHRTALKIMRSAAHCSACFEDDRLRLERVSMGVPQPRWIGSKYWQVPCRILLVLINPGQSIDEEWNQSEAKVFSQFHNGGRYDCLRTHFRQCALKGGSQHTWLCRYRDLLTWDIEEIAQINMAWCATVDNRHDAGTSLPELGR